VDWTDTEREFLRSQRLARLATVGPNGWPHVMPVMYQLKEDGSLEFEADGVKLRNLTAQPRAALVVDATQPRRGLSVQGRTEMIGHELVRLYPGRRFSWGL
jgi:pyridoxamine 5'-phosphate oxidase family protein